MTEIVRQSGFDGGSSSETTGGADPMMEIVRQGRGRGLVRERFDGGAGPMTEIVRQRVRAVMSIQVRRSERRSRSNDGDRLSDGVWELAVDAAA